MDAEDYKQYRENQKQRRAERLPIRQAEIRSLSDRYKVQELTPYQFRIDGKIDLYPIHNRYHILSSNKRGGYKNAVEFITQKLKQNGN